MFPGVVQLMSVVFELACLVCFLCSWSPSGTQPVGSHHRRVPSFDGFAAGLIPCSVTSIPSHIAPGPTCSAAARSVALAIGYSTPGNFGHWPLQSSDAPVPGHSGPRPLQFPAAPVLGRSGANIGQFPAIGRPGAQPPQYSAHASHVYSHMVTYVFTLLQTRSCTTPVITNV